MEVKQIEAKDTLKLRNEVLRPNKDINTCIFKGDEDEMTFHLGAFNEDELVSVASFYMENTPLLKDNYQYRLRGMATSKSHRKQGMSKALLNTAFPLILRNNVKTIWCNARTSAQGFYEKSGFEAIGDIFDIQDIGPHIVMFKNLE